MNDRIVKNNNCKEYGGYLEWERARGIEYYPHLKKFNLARNALAYIIEKRKIKNIYLPFLCCEVVEKICCEINVYWYDVDCTFVALFPNVREDAWIYLINYNGRYTDIDIQGLARRYNGKIIVDNVQCFFRRPLSGIDTIYSCRKFFGVPDGAYLYSDLNEREDYELPMDSSLERIRHLVGRLESDAATFFPEFRSVEELLNGEPIKRMSAFTENIMRGINYDFVADRRKKNYAYLVEKLGKYNMLDSGMFDGIFMYPLMRKDGCILKKRLIMSKVYVPTLWPNVIADDLENTSSYMMAKNVVYLPIDQRYDERDMDCIVDIVLRLI